MSATKISDLLPIPNGVDTPHAYQVFGLESGEADAAMIKAAMQQVYANLKTAKDNADPKVWKKAAKLAEKSREILSNPGKRAELDSTLKNGTASAAGTAGEQNPDQQNPDQQNPDQQNPDQQNPDQQNPDQINTGQLPFGIPPVSPSPFVNPPGIAPGTPPGIAPGTPPGIAPGTPPGIAPGMAPGTPPSSSAAPTAPDPLAGMLPSVDPLAGMLPGQAPVAGMPHQSTSQLPPSQLPPSQLPPSQPIPQQPAYPSQPVAYPTGTQQAPQIPIGVQPVVPPPGQQRTTSPPAPAFNVKKKKTKRRRSSGGKLFFVGFACLLAALVGGLAVFKMLGPGVAVREDGSVTVGNRQNQQTAQNVAQQNTRPKRPRDPVMGEMAGDQPPPAPLTSTGLPTNKFSPIETKLSGAGGDPNQEMIAPDMGMTEPDVGIAPPSIPEVDMSDLNPNGLDRSQLDMTPEMTPVPPANPDASMAVSPGAASEPTEMSEQAVAAAEKKIQQVKQLISDSSWPNMKIAADQLGEMTLTDQQRQDSDALYNLADLALHYRGGIQRGMGTLKATQDFEIADGFRVLVVEVSSSSLTVRFNARNKTYSLDDMPFRLADKLATFAMDQDKPDSIAAKWAYHAVAPLSNDEHRKEAGMWLEQVNEELPDVDTQAVAKLIEALY